MKVELQIGDHANMGAVSHGDSVTFTFYGDCSEAAILFYHVKTGKFIAKHVLSEVFCVGRVYSVLIRGYQWEKIAYCYKLDGKVITDPYAKRIVGRETWGTLSSRQDFLLAAVSDDAYVWKSKNPQISLSDMVMYQLHLRGFTMQHGLSKALRGTHTGVISLLPYLKNLGITSLSFFPLYDFEEMTYTDGKPKMNYWGYGNAYYFSPKQSYFGQTPAVRGMKELVDAIHHEGMEVIPEFQFDPSVSGELMLHCLRYWVKEFHIDGIHFIGLHPAMSDLIYDPYLKKTKLFFEDIPYFESDKKKETSRLLYLNDGYMFALRRLQNQTDGNMKDFLLHTFLQPNHFSRVNYPASANGFTLLDAYSYDRKHNEDNGENNTDGRDYTCAKNYGVEGRSRKRSITDKREALVRMALTLSCLSQGVPMIKSGDEIFNTQNGNNNPYCQDNSIGWVDYRMTHKKEELYTFVQNLLIFRKHHPMLSQSLPYLYADRNKRGIPDVSFHNKEPWMGQIMETSRTIGILFSSAYSQKPTKNDEDVMICINFFQQEETFALPIYPDKRKYYFVMNSVRKKGEFQEELLENQTSVVVPGQSVSLLVVKK